MLRGVGRARGLPRQRAVPVSTRPRNTTGLAPHRASAQTTSHLRGFLARIHARRDACRKARGHLRGGDAAHLLELPLRSLSAI